MRVRVLVFSIGFGPELLASMIGAGPGGSCLLFHLEDMKFFGDDNAASVPDQAALAAMSEEERRHSFVHRAAASRAAIVVAGPVANLY